jgi:hypothetical protein
MDPFPVGSSVHEGRPSSRLRLWISAGELKTQLHIAKEIGYLGEVKSLELKQRVEKMSGMIGSLLNAMKGGKRTFLACLAFLAILPISRLSRLSRYIGQTR